MVKILFQCNEYQIQNHILPFSINPVSKLLRRLRSYKCALWYQNINIQTWPKGPCLFILCGLSKRVQQISTKMLPALILDLRVSWIQRHCLVSFYHHFDHSEIHRILHPPRYSLIENSKWEVQPLGTFKVWISNFKINLSLF